MGHQEAFCDILSYMGMRDGKEQNGKGKKVLFYVN